MYDMTAFQRDLLYVIAGLEEPHGLEIKRELGRYYGETPIRDNSTRISMRCTNRVW